MSYGPVGGIAFDRYEVILAFSLVAAAHGDSGSHLIDNNIVSP
jgi:hypothetical protein